MTQILHMKIEQTEPTLLAIREFRFRSEMPNSELPKNQNCYRLMAFTQGAATVELNGVQQKIETDDVLYLVPGVSYRILNTYGDCFAIINLWFSYGKDRVQQNVSETVFQPRFRAELSVPEYRFEDAASLAMPKLYKKQPHICLLMREILQNTRALNRNGSLLARAGLFRVIAALMDETEITSTTKRRAADIVMYIRTHVNERLSAEELAAHFHYHKNYIGSLIKKETGLPLRQFVLREKIAAAHQLMQETDLSLTEIAAHLSFYDYSHFYKQLKKQEFGGETD